MTLPATPPISMSQIFAEFGAPAGTSLGSFLRGGTYVPNTSPNAGVPASLPISMGQLCGASAYTPMVVSAPNVNGDSWPGSNAVFGNSSSSVTGGIGPFSFAWTQISGATFTIDTPTAASTNFRRPGNPPQGTLATGTYRITYTDSTAATAFKDITVTDTRA